jgi:hypothetical protein
MQRLSMILRASETLARCFRSSRRYADEAGSRDRNLDIVLEGSVGHGWHDLARIGVMIRAGKARE